MQAFDIYCHTCHHQIHTISILSESLIDVSKCIPVDSPQRVSRDDAKANLVGDDYERFARLCILHYSKKRCDLLHRPIIKWATCDTQFFVSLNITFVLP